MATAEAQIGVNRNLQKQDLSNLVSSQQRRPPDAAFPFFRPCVKVYASSLWSRFPEKQRGAGRKDAPRLSRTVRGPISRDIPVGFARASSDLLWVRDHGENAARGATFRVCLVYPATLALHMGMMRTLAVFGLWQADQFREDYLTVVINFELMQFKRHSNLKIDGFPIYTHASERDVLLGGVAAVNKTCALIFLY